MLKVEVTRVKPEPVQDDVLLRLDVGTAELLREICGSIGGSGPVRDAVDKVYYGLGNAVGYASSTLDGKISDNKFSGSLSIRK